MSDVFLLSLNSPGELFGRAEVQKAGHGTCKPPDEITLLFCFSKDIGPVNVRLNCRNEPNVYLLYLLTEILSEEHGRLMMIR